MEHHLCIHGHFYQPPRQDPWLEEAPPEGSAAPRRNWNERISRESYAPMAWARRLDSEGRILQVLNSYEWMSFNFGPTLLSWLELGDPRTYARILEADAASLRRLGRGNAMAQAYHHAIMPLASELDKDVQVAWAVADFRARYGRDPEGMWLPEAAVDTPSLEALAAHGVRFTVLAPRQAQAVADLGSDDWQYVGEAELDVLQPYRVELESGASMDVFFYHGPLSQAVAFEGLPKNGENFWRRIAGCAGPGLLSLCTDGETYGHHVPFGEMALAYALSQAVSGRDGVTLSNYAAFLAAHPPRRKVRLHEPSSWSCVHGVERWRANCGCTTGGHPEWNQRWRPFLRAGLEAAKGGVDAHFFEAGAGLFRDPRRALVDYGRALSGEVDREGFAAEHFKGRKTAARLDKAFTLLEMERWAQASFASCAWFFDELSRIEPLNGLACSLRAMELCLATGGPELESGLLEPLEQARSNRAELGSGRDLFESMVRSRQETPARLAAQALLHLWAGERLPGPGGRAVHAWPGAVVDVTVSAAEGDRMEGAAQVAWTRCGGEARLAWTWDREPGADPLRGRFEARSEGAAEGATQVVLPAELPWNRRQALAMAWVERLDERGWQSELAKLAASEGMFLEWEEEQFDQGLAWRWARFWPALAWRWVRGGFGHGRRAESAARFLRQHGGCPNGVEVLSRRAVAVILEMLDSFPPPFDEARDLVARLGELGVEVDWWPVQARLSELGPESPEAREFARLLGFRLPG